LKILIIGSEKEHALESTYSKYLSQVADVDVFPSHDVFLDYFEKNIINKILYRLGLSNILSTINIDLLNYIEGKEFDIIWVWKGMEIFPKTLIDFKKTGAKVVNYNADHPFDFFSKGSGNKNVKNGLRCYDYHFSYSKQILKRITNELKIANSWLPFGYNFAQAPIASKLIKSVCFIGNPDAQRKLYIEKLIKSGIPVDVFGSDWEKFLSKDEACLKINGQVYQEDFIKVAQSYSVQLNIFRPHNIGSHNMRTFEMPALGCVMLSPYSEEHIELFTENEEMFFYRDIDEMITKSHEILSMPEEKLHEIKFKAHQKSIDFSYSYKSRADDVIQIFKNLAN
jgi:spore maturation protein CgeB